MEHIDNVLSRVKNEAEMLLIRHSQLSASWRKLFPWAWKGLKFALDKETITNMLESVEQAHHHLHMALMLASVNSSTSW